MVELEAPPERRDFEQGQELAGLEAAARQGEQESHGVQHRSLAANPPVGNGQEDVHGSIRGPENRLHIGGIAVDVRRHDDDVAWLQAVEPLEQV